MNARRIAAAAAAILLLSSPAAAQATVSGRVVDQGALPLPGVRITIAPIPLGASTVAITDEDGRFATNVSAGQYLLSAELQGFTRVERPLAVSAAAVSVELTLVVAVEEQVSVSAPVEPIVGEALPMAQATLTRDVIDVAMLPNNTFDDVLPLLPNVVRGPDGMISIAGARAPQGQMLVNGLSQNDPVVGEPDIMLPLEPIGSVQVFTNEYPSEFGRATGGVTVIRMRSGDDVFRVNFNSFTPRLQFSQHGISGIEAWEPNLGVSGPIVKGKVWFYEGLDFRFVRNSFDTLVGNQDNKYAALLSWSSIDLSLSANHRATFSLGFDPQKTDHNNITAFTPAATVPAFRRGGARMSATDRIVVGPRTTIEADAQVANLPTRLTPDGTAPYVIGHDVTRGAYFNTQDRTASRVEALGAVTHEIGAEPAAHVVKAGVNAVAIGFSGTNASSSVAMLRSDGTLVRTIDFVGSAHQSAHAVESALFAQDTWTVDPRLVVESGVRYDTSTLAAQGVLAPRIGATLKLDARTTISGGAGRFSDKLVLAAGAFPNLQMRAVTIYDAAGLPLGPAVLYPNRVGGALALPRADAWHVQFDRRFDRGFIARVTYQQRSGTSELVVTPGETAVGEPAMLLSSTGSSHARSVETTLGYRSPAGQSVYASYVRSTARGDLNDFGSIEGNLREPYVQPNQVGPLPADAPNRLLAWGVVKLPAQFQVAPFMELRSGFPFSPIDDEWRFDGPRNSRRYPAFASFDVFVSTVVKLPRGLPRARIGLKMYNLFGAEDARDIQRDFDRPDFGATYNPIPRDFRTIFELLWGEKK